MLVGKYVPLAYLIYPGITSLYRESAENLIRNNGRTFSAVWNIPSWNCPKLGVDLELDKYGIQHNINQSWNGSVMNIFYSKHNGHWPYFDNDAVFLNGSKLLFSAVFKERKNLRMIFLNY